MFGSIARRYDLANHLLSCGADFYWRRRAADVVAKWQPEKIVDLATGTGDLALAIARALPGAEITGVDFSEQMLMVARSKGLDHVIVADGMRLPFADGSFDCVTIAFGLRNMVETGGALREMARVLRRGGHVLVLEFSLPRLSILRGIYRVYLHHVLPLIGARITGVKSAYDYLGDSIEQFPSGVALLQLMEGNGFARAEAEPLSGGIVTLYTADKI